MRLKEPHKVKALKGCPRGEGPFAFHEPRQRPEITQKRQLPTAQGTEWLKAFIRCRPSAWEGIDFTAEDNADNDEDDADRLTAPLSTASASLKTTSHGQGKERITDVQSSGPVKRSRGRGGRGGSPGRDC